MIGLRWNQLTRQSWFRRIVICLLAYIPCTHSFSCKAANRDNNTLLANSVICAFLTDYNSANIYRQLTNDSPLFLLLHSLPTMRSKTCLWLFLPPATKLGQGYIFTGVCHSVNKEGASSRGVGGCFLRGVLPPRGGVLPPGGVWWRPPGTATAAGGTHPTGMHSSFKNKYMGLEKITAVFHFKYLEFYQYHHEAIESFKEFTIFYYFGFGRHPFWSMSRLLR